MTGKKIFLSLLSAFGITAGANAEITIDNCLSDDAYLKVKPEMPEALRDLYNNKEELHVTYSSPEEAVLNTQLEEQDVNLSINYNMTSGKESDSFFANLNNTDKYGSYTPLRDFEWTSVPLVAFGFIAKANKKDFRQARNNFIPSYKNRFDDFLQHVPLLGTGALQLAGYEGRSNLGRFFVSGVASYAVMGVIVNSIKYTAKEMRPDGSTANSFPSGHTATAFTAATIMHKEYGLTRSPWWSILGYGCATTTGIMRTLNNRHWISDVLVGAGIGVISTDLGYLIGDLIYKKKGIVRETREGNYDMIQNPSFFHLSLGFQFMNDLKLPTETMFMTTDLLYSNPGAGMYENDLYSVIRTDNPFHFPDDFNAKPGDRTYYNYGAGSTFYQTPRVKVGSGTTVGAEAAYFVNPYVGFGARARITTAPVTADGLCAYKSNMEAYPSNAVSDVWSLVDVGAGVYFSLPLNPRNNLGFKVLYGRRFFGDIDLYAVHDAQYLDKQTGETLNTPIYGDNLFIEKTNTDNITAGLHYTYSLKSGVAISAFADYDLSRPDFNVYYIPFNADPLKSMQTTSNFSYKQRMQALTLGASMVVIF